MKKLTQHLLTTLSLFFSAAGFCITPVDASIAPMLKTVMPAVVNIKAEVKVTDLKMLQELQKERGQQGNPHNEGEDTFVTVASGVIVDADKGYIITNAHVVMDAETIVITLNDRHHYTAKLIGMDKPSDIALLQIKGKNLTAMQLGNSNDLKVGDFVAAIGNPFGLNQTVTSGIISGLGRTTLGIEHYENFIQTDASINPGNSGGALIDIKGRLIGINTAILAPDRGSIGIGFAIPANMVKSVMRQLIEYGDVKRGVLGIGAQDITPELASAFKLTSPYGAAVTQVLPHSSAQLGGLQVGDVIVSVDGTAIKSASDVVNTVGFLRVDSKVNMMLLRNGKAITANVTITDAKKRTDLVEKQDPFLYGVGLKNFNLHSPLHGKVQGVLVVSVERDTMAWRTDLQKGDVIVSVNQQKVTNTDELKAQVAKAEHEVLLNVLRGPGAVFLIMNKE
jgi:Do/DeqQ family serine protease